MKLHSIFHNLKLRDIAVGAFILLATAFSTQAIDWNASEQFHASAIQAREIETLQKRIEELEQKTLEPQQLEF